MPLSERKHVMQEIESCLVERVLTEWLAAMIISTDNSNGNSTYMQASEKALQMALSMTVRSETTMVVTLLQN